MTANTIRAVRSPQTKGKPVPTKGKKITPSTASERYLELVTTPELSNPAEIQAAIVARILEADDFDAALDMAESTAIGAKQMVEAAFGRITMSFHINDLIWM